MPELAAESSAPLARRLRFSLRSLLLATILIASATSLSLHWEPWTLERTLSGHGKTVIAASFSSDGRRIVTAGWDNTARIWDAATGTQLAEFPGHHDAVHCAAFSPDGNFLVTGGGNSTVNVWTIATRELLKLEGHTANIYAVSFSPDGQRILTAGGDGTARIWDRTGRQLAMNAVNVEDVSTATFSPDGKSFITTTWFGPYTGAQIWNTANGQMLATFSLQNTASAAFSPDGKNIITANNQDTATIWDLASKTSRLELPGAGGLRSAQFSPDGTRIITAGFNQTHVWDAVTGAQLAVLEGHSKDIHSAAFSPDAQRIVTASEDGLAIIWHRRHPEYWWGILTLPEFWLTILFFIALLALARDRQIKIRG